MKTMNVPFPTYSLPKTTTGTEEDEHGIPGLTVAELKYTLQQMKEENDRLRLDNFNLRDALRQSEKRVSRLTHILGKASTQGRSCCVDLPDELLRMIFLRAVPPSTFIDRSLAMGYNSAWYKSIVTKKAIILTCRQWHRVGVEFLYEHVVFHHIGQIAALARTLESNGPLGRLIKAVEIRCAVYEAYEKLYQHDMRAIYEHCPSVTRISHCALLPSWETEGWNALQAGATVEIQLTSLSGSLGMLPSTITHLELAKGAVLAPCQQALGSFSCLESLVLQLPPNATLPTLPPVCLPHLTSLRLGVESFAVKSFQHIIHQWSMPLLQRLRLDFHTNFEFLEDFLVRRGQHVNYLHVYACCMAMSPKKVYLQHLPGSCPTLQHLVVSAGAILPETHPTVQYLDIWTPNYDSFRNEIDTIRACATQAFPRLRKMRCLDHGLSSVADWPLIFPPDREVQDAVIEYKFPGIHLRVTDDALWRLDTTVLHGRDIVRDHDNQDQNRSDSEDGSDADYEPPSASDTEDDELWSSDDGRSNDPEELFAETGEIDRDTTLSIFTRTIDMESY